VDDDDLPPPASSVQKNSNQGKNPATPKSTPQQHQKKMSSPTSSATGPPRGLAALSAPPAPNPKEDPKPQSTQIAQAAVPTLPSGKKPQGGNTTTAISPAASSGKAAPKTGEQPIKQSTPQTGAPPKPPVESPTSSPAPPPQPPRQVGVTLPEKGSGKRKTPLPEREPGLAKTQSGSTSSSTSLTTPLLVKKKHETSDVTEPDPKRARIDAGPETVAEHQRTFELGEKFWEAAEKGDEDAMKQILSENSSINVDWKNEKKNGTTPLHRACNKGYDKIVALLLAHPDIDVNVKTSGGETPFYRTCRTGRTSCAQLLLKDARVQVNDPGNDGSTPFRWAAYRGHLDIIKWWIASGREMDLGQPGNEKTDVIGAARKPAKYKNETEEAFEERKKVATLLEKFKANAVQTRTEVRMELGITGECCLILRSISFTIILDPTSLPFCGSISLDFLVTTPPKLTREQYLAFLDGKSIPPGTPASASASSTSSSPPPPPAEPVPAPSIRSPQPAPPAVPTPMERSKDKEKEKEKEEMKRLGLEVAKTDKRIERLEKDEKKDRQIEDLRKKIEVLEKDSEEMKKWRRGVDEKVKEKEKESEDLRTKMEMLEKKNEEDKKLILSLKDEIVFLKEEKTKKDKEKEKEKEKRKKQKEEESEEEGGEREEEDDGNEEEHEDGPAGHGGEKNGSSSTANNKVSQHFLIKTNFYFNYFCYFFSFYPIAAQGGQAHRLRSCPR